MTQECHGLDTEEKVCFYEQDFYMLSNFSSFTVTWKNIRFDTLEHAYHWEKFTESPTSLVDRHLVQGMICVAPSAHDAYRLGQRYKSMRRSDWDRPGPSGRLIKVEIMQSLMMAKMMQHEYVRRKLLATGGRQLTENSWRDNFWGCGPLGDGEDWMGVLWMELREWLRDNKDKF